MNLNDIRSTIRRHYSFLIIPLLVWLVYTVIGLAGTGSNLFVLTVAIIIAIGFLLNLSPRYSYIGSIPIAILLVFLMTIYVLNIYLELQFIYMFLLGFAFSCGLVLPLHFATRERNVFPSLARSFFPVFAYVFTTLFLFYVEGTVAGRDPWLIFVSLLSVVFMVLVPLNVSYRENVVGQLIEIWDVDLYYNITEDLKKTFKNQFSSEIEKVVSELKNAVFSFIYESFEVSIINCHNVLEGINRILDWTEKGKASDYINREKIESLEHWRQDVAHSNVSKSKKKNKKYEKKPRNSSNYRKAFRSIGFVVEILNRITHNS